MTQPIDVDAVASLLLVAHQQGDIADRLVAAARELVHTEELKAAPIAALIETRTGEKASSATQRLSELRGDKDGGRRWLLATDKPQRLAAILESSGTGLETFRARVERRSGGLHPAWPDVAPSDDHRLDSVPGLPGGIEDLARRVEALRPGNVLVLEGPRGIGLTTWLRRLEARKAGRYTTTAQFARTDLPLLVDGPTLPIAELRAQARAAGARIVAARSNGDASHRERSGADVSLQPWGHREVVELARRLASVQGAGELAHVPERKWRDITALAQWTPLTLGYLLRALADAGAEAIEGGRIADLLVESVARARCEAVDPEIVVEAIAALAVAVFEASPRGRWPAALSDRDARAVLESLGEGARPPIAGRIPRLEALVELARLRKELDRSLKRGASTSLKIIRRVESALRPPPVDRVRAALASCELIAEGEGGVLLAHFAAAVTAAHVPCDRLLARTGDPSLLRVFIGAIPRLGAAETKRALDAFLRSGPARQLIDLRAALAVVANARFPATQADARDVVGSAVALLENRSESPWLLSGEDVIADLRRASERYAEVLREPLRALPSVAQWLELVPPPTYPGRWDRIVLLPWQHVGEILAPGANVSLPDDVMTALLRWAVARDDVRALEIAIGSVDDAWGHHLGRRLPRSERLKLLKEHPPAKWQRHAASIAACAARSGAEQGDGAAVVEAIVALFERSDVPPTIRLGLLGDGWIEAARRSGRRDIVDHAWASARAEIHHDLQDERAAASAEQLLARGDDPRRCFAIADCLADLGERSALRELAALGREQLEPAFHTPRARLRSEIARRAVTRLVDLRDDEGLRAVLPEKGEHTTIADALDQASRAKLEDAIWIARHLPWWVAIATVIDHADDRRCIEIVRRWADDPSSIAHWEAIQCLVARRDKESAPAIARWVSTSDGALVLLLMPGLLRHPSRLVCASALRWLESAVERAETRGIGVLWPGEDGRHNFLGAIERTVIALAERGETAAAPLIERLVLLVASLRQTETSESWSADVTARAAFEALRGIDERRALALLERLDAEPGATELVRWFAQAWLLATPRSVPEAVAQRLSIETSMGAEHLAREMTIEQLAAAVSRLDDRAWIDRNHQNAESPLERHPWVAIRALASRAPEQFAAEARTRCARLAEQSPKEAVLVAEWLLDVDSDAATDVFDAVLGAGPAAPVVRRSRKRGGRP